MWTLLSNGLPGSLLCQCIPSQQIQSYQVDTTEEAFSREDVVTFAATKPYSVSLHECPKENPRERDCCPICLEHLAESDPRCPTCSNQIHQDCLDIWQKKKQYPVCMLCRTPWAPSRKYDFQDPTGPPGQMYRGQFQNSKKHGSGTMGFPLGDPRYLYKGDFFEDKMQGSGVLQWHNGKSYEGQFEDNQVHGQGIMSWPDGSQYIGEYAQGKQHGSGILQYKDGSSFSGVFRKGKKDGIGVFY